MQGVPVFARDFPASVEVPLLDQLRIAVEASDVPERLPSRCVVPALLTSCWQKSVRRGDTELAQRCALGLHAVDPGYVWRRIRCIALEEVSLADLDLVATVLAVAGKSVVRRDLGERALLHLLTQRLCATPKARTACDLLVWANHEDAADAFRRSAFATGGARPTPHLDWRAAATVQLLAGLSRRTRGHWEVVARARPGDRDRWLEAIAAPPLVRYIACRGGGTDALNLLLVLVWQVEGARGDVLWPPPACGDDAEERIGGVPAYAWCLYSAPGREALRGFLSTREPLAAAIRRVHARDPMAVLGHLVFHAQGSFCRRVWVVPGCRRIRRAGELASLRHAGAPLSAVPELEHALASSWPALNRSRRLVAARHGWPG